MKHDTDRWIPNELKKYRKIRGLSQKEVAKLLGFKTTSRISQWEKGVGSPSMRNAFKLSTLYGVLVDALFIEFVRSIRQEVKQTKEKCIIDKT
jgi:transcriptional regulator with XRE-family HTH domain